MEPGCEPSLILPRLDLKPVWKIHLCKSWKTWRALELIYVSPIAVVSAQKTSFVLKGRNLTAPGTRIHCTYMGGYTLKEVIGSVYQDTIYKGSSTECFSFHCESGDVFGRCFIEVLVVHRTS
ncbi:uncharacterized protein A4U43_C05F4320 [Asparagus officinalis]|uniref:Uncharacterized protein n=1 Tax=Asparagus officinalis TaxID=4686 RepID=A0A5P1ESZ0_ASPOF|nr:uncharacterized protein A4U43_C05F4320 [Asparagus officinalis]